jgi:hypothetical protein
MMRLFFLFLSAFTLLSTFARAKIVYIVPPPGLEVTKLFYEPQIYRDEVAKPFCYLREILEAAGYKVEFTDDAGVIDRTNFAALISFTNDNASLLANISSLPKEKCFLYVFEPPLILSGMYQQLLTQSFGKIFVMLDDMVDNVNYYKFYYPQPRQLQIENIPNFTEKKLCCLIAGNKNVSHPDSLYAHRRGVISWFSSYHPGELDLYGPGWNGYLDWKGAIPQKWDVLKNYKFSFCFENMGNQRGYITEKIFDCFVGGCVPIYLGAVNITDYIPKECFIDWRDFSSEDELYFFMKNMNEETYQNYIDAIKKYFESPQAQLYSIDNFINILMGHIE